VDARQLVIVGAGGFSREAAAAARACADWDVLGFVDDAEHLAGTVIDGLPVLGGIATVSTGDELLAIGIGRPDSYTTRMRLVEGLHLPDERYATIVHPHSSLGDTTTIGAGTIVLSSVVSTAAVRIGRHVALMPASVLTHDNEIGDFATLATGVRLGGGVSIGPGAYIGASVTVRENVVIGAWAMVGMGSVVTRDVPPGELWFGNPARHRGAAPVPLDVLERVS